MREINVLLEGENAMGERKTYLEQGKKTYKANLHCHSTLSDGKYTPQELKEHYKGQGYSILSITDHRVLNDHSDLNDEDFLLLTGFEQDFNEDREGSYALKKVSHINLIATRHDLLKKPVCDDDPLLNYEKINAYIREAAALGFLVAHNHPAWSLETAEDCLKYEDIWAMEIYNHGCYVSDGIPEIVDRDYDQVLRNGQRIFALATDDNHGDEDQFGGFVMVQSGELTYDKVIEALKDGRFYASCGPSIEELYVEDGTVHVKCSEAVRIAFSTDNRHGRAIMAENGETIKEGSFVLNKEDQWFRVVIRDKAGDLAFSNACFIS